MSEKQNSTGGVEEVERDGHDSDDDDIEIIGVVSKPSSSQTNNAHSQSAAARSSVRQVEVPNQAGSETWNACNMNNMRAHGHHPPNLNFTNQSNVNSHHHMAQTQPPQSTWKIQYMTPYPIYLKNHEPTWEHLWPKLPTANPAPLINTTNQIRAYKLSLLSHTDFTITAVMHHTNRYDFVPSLMGLRKPIKEITRIHARDGEKAVLEEGRWRIPLSVYQVFYRYLCNQSYTEVEGIPPVQLNIASIGRAAAERGYPSPEDLIGKGVPPSLAFSLAPYQRGGVDFVLQRGGKALIADEMGLGKTVQGISAMACFESEWPLLVLTPSTARYHWEAEFLNWLGQKKEEQELDQCLSNEEECVVTSETVGTCKQHYTDDQKTNGLYKRMQSGEDASNAKRIRSSTMKLLEPQEVNVIASSNDCILKPDTRVVILSYGLIGNLIKKKAIVPGQFKCIIVDESHMLKNKKSKRTIHVMPLLKDANRVVMLSGTPALAKPKELFPQLNALGERNGWWDDEEDFNEKYVKDRYSDPSFAELHALLTSTVMIRRLKKDILKDMPCKIRENVFVKVRDRGLGQQIAEGLLVLRDGKGVLGKLSLLYQDLDRYRKPGPSLDADPIVLAGNEDAKISQNGVKDDGDEVVSRKAVLNKMFHLTGTAKIPIVIDMLTRWIADPKNGKLCIFAHHMNVLDAIIEGGRLSNDKGSNSKYIRIDGSTHPKLRQEQITCFQRDPSIRVAILGITAAGVGVTLTAASTIWFAELFWTPAIMIQAEDRCHRIGQQAQVKCLYIAAKDTIDEVLWILLKRKFRALGEFVEGQEKMEMVVHKTYTDECDAVSGKYDAKQSNDLEDYDGGDMENELLEDSLQHDLEELASEDLKNSIGFDEDIATDETVSPNKQVSSPLPSTEDSVICLSDDDGDETQPKRATVPDSPYSEEMGCDELLECFRVTKNLEHLKIHGSTKFSKTQFFYAFFDGPKYNMSLKYRFGRCLIAANNGWLQLGDIIIAINEWVLKYGEDFSTIFYYLKQASTHNPVRICFCRDESFSLLIKESVDHRLSMRPDQNQQVRPTAKESNQKPSSQEGDGEQKPIEILED